MLVEFTINSARKLWHFLATTFPSMARVAERSGRFLELLVTNPAVAPIWDRIVSSPQGQAVLALFQRFWWRDYSKERIDAGSIPTEGLTILKPVMVLATILCLTVPLAMAVPWPSVPADDVVRAQGPVAAWSIVLWLLAVSVAWAGLLVGAGASNRPAFLLVMAVYLYFLGYAGFASLPASFFNLPILLTVPIALAFSEDRLSKPGIPGIAIGLVSCLVVGAGAGLMLSGLLPSVRGHQIVRLLIGAAVGMMIFWWVRAARGGRLSVRLPRPVASAALTTHVLAGLLFLFYLNLAFRGGLGTPASSVVEFLDVWSGYLWPVWYLLGTGLVFKLLAHTKVITQSLRDLVPGRLQILVVIVLLTAATLIAWSEFVVDTLALPWSQPFIGLMAGVYRLAYPLIWSEPLYAFTLGIMKWIFLIDLMIVVWLAARSRLTGGVTLIIFGHTILLWFVVNQYYFKYLGFLEAGNHSPLVTTLLALIVMWILYRVGLSRSIESSRLWPSIGRLAIYSAVLLFVLLEIHARSALHDARTMDRVFMYTFRGVIDFGLPYLLCVYASRSLKELPVAVSRLIGAFGAGAVAALVLNALDKLVAAGFSFAAMRDDLTARFDLILEGEMARVEQMIPDLPVWWTAARGGIAVVVLVAICVVVARRSRGRPGSSAIVIFLLVAAGCGIAAFSQIRLDLPIISPTWGLLIVPYRWSLEVDAHIIALFFSYTLPALVLALAVTRPRWTAAARWLAGGTTALVVHLTAVLLWPGQEAVLRSSGLIWTFGVAALGLFLVLMRGARLRVEEAMPDQRETPLEGAKPHLGTRGVAVLSAVCAVAIVAAGSLQFRVGRPVDRHVDGIDRPLPLAAAWQEVEWVPEDLNAAFSRSTISFGRPMIWIDIREVEDGGLDALLVELAEEGAQGFSDFEIYGGVDLWDRYLEGARAFEFFCTMPHPSGEPGPMIGMVALLPVEAQKVIVVVLLGNTTDFATRTWDLVHIAESLKMPRLLGNGNGIGRHLNPE